MYGNHRLRVARFVVCAYKIFKFICELRSRFSYLTVYRVSHKYSFVFSFPVSTVMRGAKPVSVVILLFSICKRQMILQLLYTYPPVTVGTQFTRVENVPGTSYNVVLKRNFQILRAISGRETTVIELKYPATKCPKRLWAKWGFQIFPKVTYSFVVKY